MIRGEAGKIIRDAKSHTMLTKSFHLRATLAATTFSIDVPRF